MTLTLRRNVLPRHSAGVALGILMLLLFCTSTGCQAQSREQINLARTAQVASARLPRADWMLEFLGVDQRVRKALYEHLQQAADEVAKKPTIDPQQLESVRRFDDAMREASHQIAEAWDVTDLAGEQFLAAGLLTFGRAYRDKCNPIDPDHMFVLSKAEYANYLELERLGVCRQSNGKKTGSGWSGVPGTLDLGTRAAKAKECMDAMRDAANAADDCVSPTTDPGGGDGTTSGADDDDDGQEGAGDDGQDGEGGTDDDSQDDNGNDDQQGDGAGTGGSEGQDNDSGAPSIIETTKRVLRKMAAEEAAEDRKKPKADARVAPDPPEPPAPKNEGPFGGFLLWIVPKKGGFEVRAKFPWSIDCLAFKPAYGVAMWYRVSNFSQDFENQGPTKEAPNALDGFNYCLCKALRSDFEDMKCHDEEDSKKMSCMGNRWGPDDGPRRECLDMLQADAEVLAGLLCARLGHLVDCSADDYSVVIDGETCACMSEKQVIGGIPSPAGCQTITCPEGSECRCTGRMACECDSGETVESSGPVGWPTPRPPRPGR